MPAITTSANAIVNVNQALETILTQYLDPENIDIRFDLPDVNSPQSPPTVSVFLYDVHEDLQLRQSEPARLNVSNSMLRAGWVNLSCNYLLTYWEAHDSGGDANSPESQADNQGVQVTTRILQALLNNRELEGIRGAYTRIIPPQENLNSLGNFWQALGNRPRLSLMYSITVPILLDNSLPQTLIKTVSSQIMQTASIDLSALNTRLRQTLCEKMGTGAPQALTRLTLDSQPQINEQAEMPAVTITLKVSGVVNKDYQQSLQSILKEWNDCSDAVTELNGNTIYISTADSSNLIFS